MKNVSLKAKVLLSMIPFIAGMAVISSFAIRDIGDVKDSLDRMVNVYGKRNQLGNEAIRAVSNLQYLQTAYIYAKNKSDREKYQVKEAAALDLARKYIDEYLAFAGEFAKVNLPKALEKLKEWTAIDREVKNLVSAGELDGAAELSLKGATVEEDFRKILDACYESSGAKMKHEGESGLETYARSKWSLWLITFLASFFGLALTWFFISKTSAAVDRIIMDLKGNSHALGLASNDLAESAQLTSQGTTEQAASLEETAASIEELSAMVKKNAENATKSFEVSNRSQESATEGRQVVGEMIQAIEEINRSNSEIVRQVEASNQEISEIVKVITEIGNKTKVINDIVFQTKLLSFNASVEAARAGEHGKGFAVVAEEVGNLAQMSGKAATEISSMLRSSIDKVESIINTTKRSVESLVANSKQKVESGAVVARRCGEVLAGIVHNVGEVNQRILEISTASQEQAKGIEEINKAVGQLDQVTQTNAAGAEQAARSASELSGQADSLQAAVRNLAVVIQGGSLDAAAHSGTGQTGNSWDHSRVKSVVSSGPSTQYGGGQVIRLNPTKEPKVPTRDDVRFKDV